MSNNKAETVKADEATTAAVPEDDTYAVATMPATGGGKTAAVNPHAAIVAKLAALYKADPEGYAKAEGNARVVRITEPDHDKRKAAVARTLRQLRKAGDEAGVTTRTFPSDDGATATIVFGVTASRKRADKPTETAPTTEENSASDASNPAPAA